MKVAYRKIVRNQSSRTGIVPRIIVLHTTEGHESAGISDLVSLGNWFDNPAAQASSHLANDADGNIARYVPDTNKAWACAGFNSVSLNLEQIGFAAETKDQWMHQVKQLRSTAEIIAHWCDKHKIPVQHGAVSGTQVTKPGVVFHSDLGTYGGGHHDPGTGFPLTYVLNLAQHATPGKLESKVGELRDRAVAGVRQWQYDENLANTYS